MELEPSSVNAATLLQQLLTGANTPSSIEVATETCDQVNTQSRACDGNRVGLFYDPAMAEHRNLIDEEHPEQPLRIISIYSHLEAEGLASRCIRLPCRLAERSELETKHTTEHVEAMLQADGLNDEEAAIAGQLYDSFFLCAKSSFAGRLSAGSVIEAVARVCAGDVKSAVCVVRPPGHHAECNRPMGFCMFGNVGLAAAVARKHGWSRRTLIVDWDVHHGNGTQRMFEEDPSVLFFSVHRHDNGSFYPNGRLGHYESHGLGAGAGYSVNMPWNVKGANRKGVHAPGDAEYVSAFERVLLPIAADFEPDLVLISAGFDAALGDPLGGCVVSPVGFHRLTEMVMRLAGGRVVLALEGGYNLDSISVSMGACVRALLHDPVPQAPPVPLGKESDFHWDSPHQFYSETIEQVILHFARFWPRLQVAAQDICSKKSEIDVPEAALSGSLKAMRRSLRHHARDTGCSLEALTRQHDRLMFKLADVPTSVSELDRARHQEKLHQGFPDADLESLPFMLPIIHIQTPEHTLQYVSLAVQAGAHGVWLINSGHAPADDLYEQRVYHTLLQPGSSIEHSLGQSQLSSLLECFQIARKAFPRFWIGLCIPQLNPAQAFSWIELNCATANGLWLDDLVCKPADVIWETMGEGDYALQFAIKLRAWFDEESQLQLQAAQNARRRCSWPGLVFCTAASRFQERYHHDQDSESMGEACQAILRHWAALVGLACDVVVTTGPGDGGPCALAKLRALSAGKPVACLGPVVGERAGHGASDSRGVAVALLADVAELGGLDELSNHDLPQGLLDVDPDVLKDWVLTGRFSIANSRAQYEPGVIRKMAAEALEQTRAGKVDQNMSFNTLQHNLASGR